ncbi:hypothetical protein J6590_084369 [Homalodisca vitripennis]|nr:hypothetical protein J6590_084369 [Homalodisca vitripennis]
MQDHRLISNLSTDSSLETAYRFKLRARPNFDFSPEGSHLSSCSDLGSSRLYTLPR